MSEWSFLTSHALVLGILARYPRITAGELALNVGITERAARKVIADLDAAGYITKKREGRRIRYRVNPDLSIRHDAYQDITVGELLEVLGWVRRRRAQVKLPGQELVGDLAARLRS